MSSNGRRAREHSVSLAVTFVFLQIRSCFVDLADLNLAILLPQPLGCQAPKCVPPCPTLWCLFYSFILKYFLLLEPFGYTYVFGRGSWGRCQGGTSTHNTAHMWMSVDNLQWLSLFFHHEVWAWTQIIKLGSKHIYWWSHLSSPCCFIVTALILFIRAHPLMA